jgi:hypothetical protein
MTDVRDIGSRLELFVDDWLVDRLDGAERVLHSPVPQDVALVCDAPWEGNSSKQVTVFEDGGLYRMYYRGSQVDYTPGEMTNHHQVTCYAESADGIDWVKPDLGLFEVAGTRDNNVILTPEVAGDATHNFSPMLDRRPGVPESEQYKALGGSSRKGLTAFVSEDAVTWRKLREEPVITEGAFDSQNVCFWSWSENLYLCYFRIFTNRVRTVARTTSKDFLTWSEPVEMEFGGAPMEQLYTTGTTSYFRAPHIYVALPGRFWPARKALSDEDAAALDVSEGSGAANDCSDAVFMTTRGGNRYDRTFMESFVRPGLEQGNWVSRANYPAQGVVPTGDTEMSIYVGRGMGQEAARLERLALRTDGFSSLHGGYGGGEMLTRPFWFGGSELQINYATSAAGNIRIELHDETGAPIDGFTLEDCDPIIGDDVDRAVTWNGSSHVSSTAKRPIRLRFALKDADLYSLRFR